jgi:curved DNA-binding protein CbpA
MKSTLYEVLGVPENAALVEIENAYAHIERNRARLSADPNDIDALNTLKFAGQAFAILSNPVGRAKYDEHLRARRERKAALLRGTATKAQADEEEAGTEEEDMASLAWPRPGDVVEWNPAEFDEFNPGGSR